jgi:hypothetical protein
VVALFDRRRGVARRGFRHLRNSLEFRDLDVYTKVALHLKEKAELFCLRLLH